MGEYFEYQILFFLHLIGFIVLLVFSFGGTSNKNLKKLDRSYFCYLIIMLIIIGIIISIALTNGIIASV